VSSYTLVATQYFSRRLQFSEVSQDTLFPGTFQVPLRPQLHSLELLRIYRQGGAQSINHLTHMRHISHHLTRIKSPKHFCNISGYQDNTDQHSGSRCDYTNDQRYPKMPCIHLNFDAFVSLCSQVRSSLTLLQSTCRLLKIATCLAGGGTPQRP